ncbi:MAG: hypothetical protein QM760_16170 [Nibricoccus sp.]
MQKSIAGYLEHAPVTGSTTLKAVARDAAAIHVAEVFEVNPAVARIRLTEMFPDQGRQDEF